MALFRLSLLLVLLQTTACQDLTTPNQIHLIMPHSGAAGTYISGLNCASWRLGVETNNVIEWKTIPDECIDYVGHYMVGNQYREDCKLIINEALRYVKSLELSGDGNDIWVFDVDETTLSNLPYYAAHNFGYEPYNSKAFEEWVLQGRAPALPETLKLYQELVNLGVKIVFLTGRTSGEKDATATNLKKAGYHTWEKLIVKDSSHSRKKAVSYKSEERAKLEKSGYRIIGNMGDQWSDILGTNIGNRTFKLPDPMYYIS